MHRNAVAMIADKQYFPAAVFLAHKLSQLNCRSDTDVVLLSNWRPGLADAAALVPKVNLIECDFDEPDFGKLQPRPTDKPAYFIFCMPRILSAYSRILYLDIDVYVASGKLFDLFDLDLGDYPIAAVRDINIMFRARHLNSGVVLIETDIYGRTAMERKAFELIRSQEQLHPIGRDQPIFNKLYRPRWLELSPAFNLSAKYMRTELAEAFAPEILHFIGPVKPWTTPTYDEQHLTRSELVDFLRVSPWNKFIDSFHVPSDLSHLSNWLLSSLRDLGEDTADFLSFLRTTQFADVAQGLTIPKLDRLPSTG